MLTLRRKLIGDLKAQTGAFFAVWLTAVAGLTFYGSTYPSGVAMIDSFYATYDQLHYADFDARFDLAPQDAVVDAVMAVAGVTAVDGRLIYDAGLELEAPDRLTLHLISFPDDGHPAVNDVLVTEGDELTAPGQIFLLESFANYHDIVPGDTVRVWVEDQLHELTVTGLVFAPEYLIAGQSQVMPFPLPSSFGVGYMRHTDLAALTGYADGEPLINDVVLTIADNADEAAIRAALESALEPYTLEFVHSRVQTASGGVMDANIKGDLSIAAVFSAIFLSIGGLVMAILLARLMDAETRRIGTMRALGLSRGEALRHYLAFPIIIGTSSAVVGSISGYIGSFFVGQYLIQVLMGGSLPTFVNHPQWSVILLGAAVTIGLALVAAILPTWRASGTDPGLALRPVTPKGMGAQARIHVPGLPLAAQQAFRNILRVPVRTINTLVGVILGITVIISASGMADSTVEMMHVQIKNGQHFDLQVMWSTLAPTATRESQVADVPGVNDFEMILVGPVDARFDDHALNTYAVTLDPETDFYTFQTIAGEKAFSRPDAVWIGHNLARVIGVDVGDDLTMIALGQEKTARVAGIFNLGIGSMVYVPAPLMDEWTLNVPMSNMALVRADSESIDDVRRRLTALDGVVAVDDMSKTNGDLDNYMSLFINMPRIFQSFGYLLTLLVLFNTVSINLHERREELAIMRAMGASIGEIALTVTWETLSVTFAGILIGLPLGWAALDVLMNNYELDFFGLLNYIAPTTYALAIGGIVAIVLLAEWLSLRSLRKVDLGYLSKTLSM